MSHTPAFTRPVRGAVRLDSLHWDTEALRREIAPIERSEWKSLNYGTHWSDIGLYVRGRDGGEFRHPLLEQSPALQQVLAGFPARPIDMCLAMLEPGGAVKEHRDISGGVAAGVIRLHIPIVTHPDVAFFIEGQRVSMAEGEVWTLDTSYRHRVANNSPVTRIHLILDLEASDELRAMLPARDFRDRLHTLYFAGVCAAKGGQLVLTNPRQFVKRATNFVRLRFLHQSVLYSEDR